MTEHYALDEVGKYDCQYYARMLKFSSTEKYDRELKYVFDRINIYGKEHVLDIGCGHCRAARLLEAPGDPHVVGVDFSDEWLHQLKHTDSVELRQGSVYEIPARDCDFDLCIAIHLFQSLERPLEALREIRRVADAACIVVPNWWFRNMIKPFNKLGIIPYKPDPTVQQDWTKRSLYRLMRQAGFTPKQGGYFGDKLFGWLPVRSRVYAYGEAMS